MVALFASLKWRLLTSRLRAVSPAKRNVSIAGLALVVRWFILRYIGDDASRVPSLVGASVLLLIAALILVLGFMADIQAGQRQTMSDILILLRRREFAVRPDDGQTVEPEHEVGEHDRGT